eukprot:NODE_3128_length_451_cov_52.259259_g3078_i0.p1 GENE.NODE_3128_length_451_cov_52.259259_g3078_i0~~NODE_3128_length_451_cov_52.259259_g3078_i0.p1  ORF type:complete len:101 (+),score=22.51 NODE_3128_length_451_cov_52.259259_g3078_i0:70-372(+)
MDAALEKVTGSFNELKGYTSAVDFMVSKQRDDDIKKTVAALSPDQLDLLMKVIYKGMESAKSSTPLFKWHAAVADAAGTASIVRVMTDRPPPFESEEAED